MGRISIVSNRLPPLHREEVCAGGLAVGLAAALAESGGTWLGWDGTIASAPEDRASLRQAAPYALLSLTLSQQEHAEYYVGFANRTLWPLLHGRADLVRFDARQLATYRAVNARFARQLVKGATSQDVIWVHDYHLLCLGNELRRLGIKQPIGFFLHVPFPSPEVIASLPAHRELFGALADFDLVGFQTAADLRNFHLYVARFLGGIVLEDGSIAVPGRRFTAGVFPIGIDTKEFSRFTASENARLLHDRLRECFHDRLGIVGVDRLDYTKGIENRLLAFENLLERAPHLRNQVFLLQIAAPSREMIPEYAELKRELETLSGRINARHARVDWTPVRYINRTFSQDRLAAVYRFSRVGLVTPLRDGMNLVAKEYVAAQAPDDPGVLVLSRFAGAAERLSGALLVDPYDIGDMAMAMRRALYMSLDERRERWSEMITEIRDHDVHGWREDFLCALSGAARYRSTGDHCADPGVTPRDRPTQRSLTTRTTGQCSERSGDATPTCEEEVQQPDRIIAGQRLSSGIRPTDIVANERACRVRAPSRAHKGYAGTGATTLFKPA